MRNKTLLSAVSVLLTFQLLSPALAEPEVVPADSILGLSLKKNYCINASLQPPHLNRSSEQFLLSIDGENLRRYSFAQIKKKLSGPLGTSVRVQIGYQNGNTESFEIERQPVINRYEDKFADPLSSFENGFSRIDSSINHANLLEIAASNTDLFARNDCSRAADDCKEKSGLINAVSIYLNCMLLKQAIGDFDSADRYLSLALDRMKTEPPNSNIGFRERAVILNLVALGKSKEAEEICKYLLLPEPKRIRRLPAAITVLDAYSLIPTESAQSACRDLAENIVSGKTRQVVGFHQDTLWLAQYLEMLGWSDKAIDLYAKEQQKLQKDATFLYSNLYGPQVLAFSLYSKARLEAQMGKNDIAENDLAAINTCFKSMPEKQQNLLNRIPEFFPALDDVEKARQALKNSLPIAAPPKVTSFSNQFWYDADGNLISTSLEFLNAQKCFRLISEERKSEAEQVAEILVSKYQVSSPLTPNPALRQNLFCTILNVARAFADHGAYEASDRVLTQLEVAAKSRTPKIADNDVAWTMIAAERIYNAVRAGRKADWTLNPIGGEKVRGSREGGAALPSEYRLALLAMAYNYAGKTERAKVFIEQSLLDLKNRRQMNGMDSTIGMAPFIFLTAACIYAKLSDFKVANLYLDEAFAQNFELKPNLSSALFMLATTYSDNGNTSEAISILERRSRLIQGRQPQRIDSEKFDIKLAELYRQNGQNAKALVTIKKVLSDPDYPGFKKEKQFAAELCEQVGNFCEAAKWYYEAGKPIGNMSDQKREKCLHKAIECAEKATDADKSVISKAYQGLCDFVDATDFTQRINLQRKALDLLEDSDPNKIKVLSVISYLQGELRKSKSQSAAGKNKNEPYKRDSSTKLAQSTDDEITTALKAAELATKNKSTDATDYWFRVAFAEANAKKIGAAIEHARKCISTYYYDNVKGHVLSQLIPSQLPCLIAKSGSPQKAEQILREAQDRVESIAGVGSLPAQTQMCHYIQYLVQRKDYSNAERILDVLLKTNLKQGNYSPPNHDSFICRFGGGPYPVESTMEVVQQLFRMAKQTVAGKDNRQALRFLDKILAAQTEQLGKDDYRVALTYAEIGRSYSASDEYENAYNAFNSAIRIMHEYEGIQFVLSNVHPDYYNILRKLHKESEIEKLEEQKLEEQRNRQARSFGARRNSSPSK